MQCAGKDAVPMLFDQISWGSGTSKCRLLKDHHFQRWRWHHASRFGFPVGKIYTIPSLQWLTPHVCSWHGLVKVSLQICLIAWMNSGRRFFPNTWVLCSNVFKWVASRPLWILWLSRSFQPNLGWWSQKLNDNLLARMAQCLWVDFAELIPKVGEMYLLRWCAKSSSSVGWKTKLPSIKYHKLCIIGINLIDVKWCKGCLMWNSLVYIGMGSRLKQILQISPVRCSNSLRHGRNQTDPGLALQWTWTVAGRSFVSGRCTFP